MYFFPLQAKGENKETTKKKKNKREQKERADELTRIIAHRPDCTCAEVQLEGWL